MAAAQTLYWNGGYEGDQGWSTTESVTPWALTPTGDPETYWVPGYDAVFTATTPDVDVWTAVAGTVTIQDGATFTTKGTSGHSLTVNTGGSGDFTIKDNSTGDGILRVVLDGTSAWDGTITVQEFNDANSGLVIDDSNDGSATSTGKSTKIVLDGGKLMLGAGMVATTATIGELSGQGIVKIRGSYSNTRGVRMLKIDQDTNTTFSGTFGEDTTRADNRIAMTKAGTGTLVISSTSGLATDAWGGYSGETIIEAGSLYLIGSSATTYTNVSGQNSYTVFGGATFGLDGTLTFGSNFDGLVTVQDGGILDPGRQNASGTMTLAGGNGAGAGLVFEGAANIRFNLGTNQDMIVLEESSMVGSANGGDGSVTFIFYNTGDVVIGETYNIISFGGTAQGISLNTFALSEESLLAGWDGTFSYGGDGNELQFTVSAVPEPAEAALLLGLLVGGIVALHRRRS
ncbi:hypothetical protein H5P28_16780 [Ruficoccus amylovorans]|uniref:PEP-CTERM protein-sorting domain-containing protein n=1 Tax=Ruficoccus amylovorans TaxID=1804625 RepID=A0A842HHN7_9BACT|nr:hypothetical protein [Ruficoccus amylovorans]MBC2595922.1 hypothetical protein [Ruficoccus amylovorans]